MLKNIMVKINSWSVYRLLGPTGLCAGAAFMEVFGGKTIVVQARAIPEGMDAVESRRTEKIIVVVESCVCPVEELVYGR